MSKVTFVFDESEDRADINIIVDRHKLMSALLELSNYRKSLYNTIDLDFLNCLYFLVSAKVLQEV